MSCLTSCTPKSKDATHKHVHTASRQYEYLELPGAQITQGHPGPCPPATYQISVLLFNVWCLPGPLSDGHSRRRARLISPLLDAYDVVALNEAFLHKKYLLQHSSHRHVSRLGTERRWCTAFGSGVLLLSKHPIVAAHWEEYSKRAWVDRLAAKGVLHCRLQLGPCAGHVVDVCATHMQAGHGACEQAARHSQAKQLAAFVNRHCARQVVCMPAVAVGDQTKQQEQQAQQQQVLQLNQQEHDKEQQQGQQQQVLKQQGLQKKQDEQEVQQGVIISFPAGQQGHVSTNCHGIPSDTGAQQHQHQHQQQLQQQQQQHWHSPPSAQQPASAASISTGTITQPHFSHPVVLVGDLNMGPPNSTPGSSHSSHYASAKDAAARHAAYDTLRNGAGLKDCVAESHPDDINRFLLSHGPWEAEDSNDAAARWPSSGSTGVITKAAVCYEHLVGPEGQCLSDSEAVVCRMDIVFHGIEQT